MKLRDSGMPAEAYWETLLQPAAALDSLGLCGVAGDAVEFGCGYGTFTLPLAARLTGTLWAYDIDPVMVARTAERATAAGLPNVVAAVRDLFAHGTDRPAASVAVVTIFNLLHCQEPQRLLTEARRIVAPDGCLAVAHWVWDASTPRGPDLSIRPRPEQLRDWAAAAGFNTTTAQPLALPPYHYGWVLRPWA
ncbi:MAG: class I SAM-dependent methyltransferase [Fimbriimonadaceae bacterium]|nr:class I SAM-dependent methyltransferase [Fimbriimonadaceae bacterium]